MAISPPPTSPSLPTASPSASESNWLGNRFQVSNGKTLGCILNELEKDACGPRANSLSADTKLLIFDKIFAADEEARRFSAGNSENMTDDLSDRDKAISAVHDDKVEKVSKTTELVQLYNQSLQGMVEVSKNLDDDIDTRCNTSTEHVIGIGEEKATENPSDHPQPSSKTQPTASSIASQLANLKEHKRCLEDAYKRLNGRVEGIYMRTLALAGVFATILVSMKTLEFKSQQCVLCGFLTIESIICFMGLLVICSWEHERRLAEIQLQNVSVDKQEKKEIWIGLKEAGAVDLELEYWFIDEGTKPTKWFLSVGFMTAGATLLLSVLLMTSCWMSCLKEA